MENQQTVSLDALNLNKRCEQGSEFQYMDENDNPTGVFITVIGGHAEKIKAASFASFDRQARIEAQAKRRGKDVEPKALEEIAEEGLKITALRVVAWRGITEECNPENVLRLLRSNALIVRQVTEHSENLANFTRSK